MTSNDPNYYRRMTPQALLAAYLSMRDTARRSRGHDRDFDMSRYVLIEDVARERGLLDLLVQGMQAMRVARWERWPAEVAAEVCGVVAE